MQKSKYYCKKRFGQHFLLDESVLADIIGIIRPNIDKKIIEIGPGAGALTKYLATGECSVTAIEIDNDLVAILQKKFPEELATGRLRLLAANVLSLDLRQLLTGSKETWVVGNLPYNIATEILFKLFDYSGIDKMCFMLQKEVAERLVATPGSKKYGRLSVMTSYYADVQYMFNVSAEAFSPPPKVESAVVTITPKKIGSFALNPNHFATIVRKAFSCKRKTLSNNLKGLISASELEKLGINPRLRAENLPISDFVAMSDYLIKS